MIPSEILNSYKEEKNAAMPIAIRAMTNVNSKLGETYLLGNHNSLILYTGKFGHDKTTILIDYADITTITVEQQQPFALLLLKYEY